ncbi:TPA: hypothetical protein EYP66_24590 [Candidatus Poribacteria bacterium]|nr:hypothetical protein [Candidatus Poribacteria bacterium]
MTLPELNADGYLDPGIYLASLDEVLERFGAGSPMRERQGNLLRLIVESARKYPTIKRVLLWGSFVSDKTEPADLDYSIVVDPRHHSVTIEPGDRRFFVPFDANIRYGVDRGYLLLYEYPPELYAESILFFCQDRRRRLRGILEVSCHGKED